MTDKCRIALILMFLLSIAGCQHQSSDDEETRGPGTPETMTHTTDMSDWMRRIETLINSLQDSVNVLQENQEIMKLKHETMKRHFEDQLTTLANTWNSDCANMLTSLCSANHERASNHSQQENPANSVLLNQNKTGERNVYMELKGGMLNLQQSVGQTYSVNWYNL